MTRASDTAKLLGAGATILDGTTITTADNTPQLTLTSTDADESSGPNILLKRDSASPADNDTVGRVKFVFDNDAGEETEAVRIDAFIPDVSNGTEDATFQELTMVGGTMRSRVEHSSTETVFNQDSQDIDFRVEGNGDANLLVCDAGSDFVAIGESSQVNGGKLSIATSASDTVLSFLCRSTTDSHQPEIIMQKSSAASGNFAATADGEALGSVAFKGVDTQPVSQIAGAIDVVQDGTASGSVPATMRFSTGGSERMRLQADGTLSINTTTDAGAKLFAFRGDSGDVSQFQSDSSATSGVRAIVTSLHQNSNNTNCQHLRSTTQGIATFTLNGNGSSTFSSDERLKKNIETTRDGYLEDLAKLRVVKYNWHNADVSTDKELGLIAQEVQKVFPKLVVEDDEPLNGIEKPLALKVSVLPMMLLKALQEANTKITALEARITTLEGA